VNSASGSFKPGDLVKVKFEDRPGHLRTPWYIRGKTGRIERVYGDFLNPELLAFGRDGLPKKVLYQVVFEHRNVFGESTSTKDKVLVDIYDHWLEPAAKGSEQ
jgi:nitrile hydratase